MTAPSDIATPRNFAAGIGSVLRIVVPLPCATGDDRKPVRLLPRRRLTAAILPIVSRATGAACGGDDLGSGVIGQGGGEAHGETLHQKK